MDFIEIDIKFSTLAADNCQSLSPPTNGGVSASSTAVGSTATYSCNPGYSLVGASTRSCESQRSVWSGNTPSCQGNTYDLNCCFGQPFLLLQMPLIINLSIDTVLVRECPSLTNPTNGSNSNCTIYFLCCHTMQLCNVLLYLIPPMEGCLFLQELWDRGLHIHATLATL